MNFFRKPGSSKLSAILMLLVFTISTFNPTIAFAISTGPAQPELQGFTPVGMDNMVNLSTGDFSYNLPLLTVPGPGGGYPINMSYQAQPGMDAPASWVGLGWSLNPGVVNRTVRGLPDDFSGQKVQKALNQKPNQTITFNVAAKNIEALGFDLTKILSSVGIDESVDIDAAGNLNFSYNNYNGFKVSAGIGFSESEGQATSSATDAQDKEVSYSFGFANWKEYSAKSFKKSLSNYKTVYKDYFENIGYKAYSSKLFSFASPRTAVDVPYDHPRRTFSFSLNTKGGFVTTTITGDLEFDVFFSRQFIGDKIMHVPAYGYLFNDLKYAGNDGLSDFSRENQAMITPSIKTIPIPNFTYDIFHVSGQGVSGQARAYRNEVAKLTDPKTVSGTGDVGIGLEFNGGVAETKVGVNPRASVVSSSSGDWTWGAEALKQYYSSVNSEHSNRTDIEPYVFKFGGELTAASNESTIHMDQSLGRFDLGKGFNHLSSQPKLRNSITGSGVSSLSTNTGLRAEREKRAKLFSTLTERQVSLLYPYTRKVRQVNSSTTHDVDLESDNQKSNSRLIGEVRVTNEAGNRYIYGIPAKNYVQKQVTFSTEEGTNLEIGSIPKQVPYSGHDNSYFNSNGRSEYYNSTSTPEHAHSYLLTEVLSEDYRDLSSNGPSPDDLGSYIAFKYQITKNFKSKSPQTDAFFMPGNFSDEKDNKASYTYFEKDLYYLDTIRTKTHAAVFVLDNSPRQDGYGVAHENLSSGTGADQYSLKRIDLYSLEDLDLNGSGATPIKSVNFEYSYELCEESLGSGGKLTLKKVWYSSGGHRTKQSLSPYVFHYGESGTRSNPLYNGSNVDRWGTYQRVGDNEFGSNIIFPYTSQKNRTLVDSNAGAWSLQEIELPTGGRIKVTYEADDYSWVQNKRAQKMFEIEGFASSGELPVSPSKIMSNTKDWLVLKLPQAVASDADLSKFFDGFKQTYFKALVNLRDFNSSGPNSSSSFNSGSGNALEYVEGFLEVEPNTAKIGNIENGFGDRLLVKVKSNSGHHPIQKAAWIHLKNGRMDLMDRSGISLDNFGKINASMLESLGNIFGAIFSFAESDPFFRKAESRNWASSIAPSTKGKSILRLNSLENKVGGGHRVKKVEISDEWSEMGGSSSYTYGQTYSYNDPVSGKSYGVAQFEPGAGAEENPFRMPEYFDNDAIFFNDEYMMVQKPYGEGFFPNAQVGYSKVIVKNLANEQVETSGAGVQVHEFYTAKDYPTIVEKTDLKKVNAEKTKKILAFIGGKNYFEPGFSQGFKVELNNMHGKSKRTATYAAGADILLDPPSQEKKYFYKTKNGYSPSKINKLDNRVTVFQGDGFSTSKQIGVNQDTYFDLKESSTWSIGGDLNPNLSTLLWGLPIPIPTIIPNIDYNYNLTRWVSMTKVVERTAVLEKVVSSRDGARVTEEYLGFDFDTGQPVLTSTTSSYNDKTYNYNQLAKWYYDDLGGKYQNHGLIVRGNDLNSYAGMLHPGDMLMNNDTGTKVWAVKPTANTVYFYDKDGIQVSPGASDNYILIESGYANRLGESAGFIQTIGNPVGDLNSNFSLFKAYNALNVASRNGSFSILDCESGQLATMNATSNPNLDVSTLPCPLGADCSQGNVGVEMHFTGGTYTCNNDGWLFLFGDDGKLSNVSNLDLYYLGGWRILGIAPDGTEYHGQVYGASGNPIDIYQISECFDFCLEGVLNTGFSRFSEDLRTFEDYEGSTTGMANNPYYYHSKGVFTPWSSFFYPTTRTQASGNDFSFTTNIAEDGEYDRYGPFTPNQGDGNWKPAMEVVKVDHNGNVVEENNALEIPSAVLYGYNGTLPIATAQNSEYSELVYDGFEDHVFSSGNYNSSKKNTHLSFNSGVSLSSNSAHTGKYSLKLSSSSATSNELNLEEGRSYVAYLWHQTGSGGSAKINAGGQNYTAKVLSPNIEGWELLEIVFTAGNPNSQPITLVLSGSNAVFDDIRIQPFNSAMKCFVYDERTHQLVAELDANHFATFYNYDKDQTLVQVKKETQRGIKTIQSTQRSNAQLSSN